MQVYSEEKLKDDSAANYGRPYRQCSISVMDTIADPNITFDENGICNHYHEYNAAVEKYVFLGDAGRKKLEEALSEIKLAGKNNQYDCILGISGGVDSTYLAYLVKKNGLRPLAVHFDYGWNSELAVHNIHTTVEKLGIELYTEVMNWEEFRDLLRSYFKAGVLDLDVPADHMIFGAMYKIAKKFNIKYILSGNNVTTEFVLPKAWNYNKFDYVNIRNIQKKFGTLKLRHLPRLGYWDTLINEHILKIKKLQLLNYIEYNKEEIKATLIKELDWRDYGGKHHESIFTRFYQGYILPVRFGIDKRKAHLSTLIFARQLTKDAALQELSEPSYSLAQQKEDFEYVAKKLGFSLDEFSKVLTAPIIPHSVYGTDQNQRIVFLKWVNRIRNLFGVKKKK